MVISQELSLNPENYTLQLYLIKIYYNIYLEDYAFSPINIKDLKFLLHCYATFI